MNTVDTTEEKPIAEVKINVGGKTVVYIDRPLIPSDFTVAEQIAASGDECLPYLLLRLLRLFGIALRHLGQPLGVVVLWLYMKKFNNYHGHEHSSEVLARIILNRLRYPKDVIEQVCRLCGLHMYDMRGDAREAKGARR